MRTETQAWRDLPSSLVEEILLGYGESDQIRIIAHNKRSPLQNLSPPAPGASSAPPALLTPEYGYSTGFELSAAAVAVEDALCTRRSLHQASKGHQESPADGAVSRGVSIYLFIITKETLKETLNLFNPLSHFLIGNF